MECVIYRSIHASEEKDANDGDLPGRSGVELKNLENRVSPNVDIAFAALQQRRGAAYRRNRKGHDDYVKNKIGDGAAPDDGKGPRAVLGLGAVPEGRKVVAALDAEEDGVGGSPERAEGHNGHDYNTQYGPLLFGTEDAVVEEQRTQLSAAEAKGKQDVSGNVDLVRPGLDFWIKSEDDTDMYVAKMENKRQAYCLS